MGAAFGFFWASLYLSFAGYIRLRGAGNLVFLGALYATWVYPKAPRRPKWFSALRALLGAAAGGWLLWSETWLPSPHAAWGMLRAWGMPSGAYVADFLARYLHPLQSSVIAACAVAGFLLRKRVRALSIATAVALALAGWLHRGNGPVPTAELNGHLSAFYAAESQRLVPFKPPENPRAPVDVVVLSVCSLSWQDLRDAGLADHPLFSEFDYLFTNFNSVSSYSNPAVLRLLTANRGQARHAELYDGPAAVSLPESLRGLGYSVAFALNHDGAFGDFLAQTAALGRLDGRVVPPKGLPARLRMFDDSPVVRDYDALKQTWDRRLADGGARAAIVYNTVSLHDGNYSPENRELWKTRPLEVYASTLRDLLDDVARFLRLLESSGRRIVVVFVPEHGRFLRGNSMQVRGLRDVPLPEITNVPVGVKLIGPRAAPGQFRPLRVDAPASYLALAYMLSVFIEKNPFLTQGFDSPEFVRSIPRTDFVAENEENTVVEFQGRYWHLGKGRGWSPLADKKTP